MARFDFSAATNARHLLELGRELRQQDLRKEALQAFELACTRTADACLLMELNYWSGLICDELNQDAAAIEYLRRAVAVPSDELDPPAKEIQSRAALLLSDLLDENGL